MSRRVFGPGGPSSFEPAEYEDDVTFRHLAVSMTLAATSVLAASQDRGQPAPADGSVRTVYISATAGDGTPAVDLAPGEVVIKENGRRRDVLAVGPATGRMSVAMLVDDSGPGIQHVRLGVAEFIRILQAHAEFAIVSTAGQNSVVVDFTTDLDLLNAGVRRLMTRTTSGGYLLDAIRESALTLQRREAARPVIVVLALEGTEYSSLSVDRVLEAVRQSGAIVHVLSVGKPTLKTMTPWNQRPTQSIHEGLDETISRSTVLAEAPRRSGGRLEQVLEASGLPARMGGVARDLRDQLAVTYVRPALEKGGGKIEVSVTRRGIRLRAPRQVS
jgi:hypothetical protein